MAGDKHLKWMKEIYATEKVDGWKVEIDKIEEEWKVKVVIYRKDWQHPFEWNAWFSEFKDEIPFNLFKKAVIYEAFKFCFAEELEKFEGEIYEKELNREKLLEEEKVEERKEGDQEKNHVKEKVFEEEFYQDYEEPLYEPSFEAIEEDYLDKEMILEEVEAVERSYELEGMVEPAEEIVKEQEGSKISMEEMSSKENTFLQMETSKELLEEPLEEPSKVKKPAKITLEQMQLIAKLLPNKSHKQRLKRISRILGREINTYGEISYEEAETVIRELQGAKR